MRISICHYSFSRTLKKNNWSCKDFAKAAESLGVEGIDFHAVYLGCSKDARKKIKEALDATGLKMSALSISNNFNKENIEEFRNEISYVKEWIGVASEVNVPLCRIFGGHIVDRSDNRVLKTAFDRVSDGLAEVVKEAEKCGIILAIENHGNLPCTAREQVGLIKQINSDNLRATVDVGNYMQGGEESNIGTAIAAPYCSYVHFKDFKKKLSNIKPWGWDIEPCAIGEGDVNHLTCLQEIKKSGYDDFVALEYEGLEDETTAIPKSIQVMNNLIKKIESYSCFATV